MNIVGPFPWTIVTNNDRQFINKKLTKFYKNLEIKHVISSLEHPQMNNQVEVVNKTIVAEIKRRLSDKKGAWVDELPEVLWAYRCTLHETTNEMPFKVGESSLRRHLKDSHLNEAN